MPGKKKKYNARFPPARIKKIMQSDEEVGKVAAAVPVIISRALELFVENMLKKANEVTSQREARTLTPSHLKFCINSESRFDFLKELVSGVPDLQGDMDINLDSASIVTTVGEPLSPAVAIPSPLTTSSLTWPSEYSAGSSNTLPSNISATSAVATSSSLSSSVAIPTASVSQQYPKSHFKNSTNKNNNTSTSRSSSGSQNEATLGKSHDERNSLESNGHLNTKVVRKRGRPRKSSNDAPSSNKPKNPKTSSQEDSLLLRRKNIPGVHTTQYSLSYESSSGTILDEPDVKAATKLDKETKSRIENAHEKSNSFSENSAAEMHRQISRTYSTGSIPSPKTGSPTSSTNSTIPSFTLTFPIISQNTENAESMSKPKACKIKNNTKNSSQIESKPKLKNNSKESVLDSNSPNTATATNHTCNNGFPFTISNILENEHKINKVMSTANTQEITDANNTKMGHGEAYGNKQHQNGSEKNQEININTMPKVDDDKTSGKVSEKITFPTISWTMNVETPKINTSEEIDEDYDA